MKNIFSSKNLPWVVLTAGGIGLILRILLLATGVDEKGFLVQGHIADILVWVLTAATIAMVLFCTRRLQQATKYQFNFPQSMSGAIGCALGAAGIAIASVAELLSYDNTLALVSAIVGLVGTVALGYLGYCRYKGLHPSILCHAVICIFLMLRLINQYRHWSSDPQLQDYCFQLLATVCLMLATSPRETFDANAGSRRPHAIYHLCAVYFCCLSLAGSDGIAFYLGTGIWMLTDLCSLIPMPEQPREES